ncbi:rhamnulokinase [Fictibacillus fluitans]|uniref:Rhamnulokinase n=1 Tax=Fictibacillus fluitans TaxID=3058422 RepID=A0ABT8I0U0_9BACL|nr:rhamnulokinase [Fictibacillus sp. NE201]MDN4526649.1 rhamnulokinase [Fictibacillus sp. NE201]
MGTYCLAVDIGASSGRMIAGTIIAGKLELTEVHRFENKIIQKGQHSCWDTDRLFQEIKTGIMKCKKQDIQPQSIGIDTWAVDFVLLDGNDNLLTDCVSYRDPRTDGMMEKVFEIFSKERLYLETGIQFQKFNTIYQLYSLQQNCPEVLKKAESFLLIPEYFNFLLAGVKASEYTNASSTQLVNAFTKKWDDSLMDVLSIKKEMFHEIKMPKTVLGPLRKELAAEFGMDIKVILPATHDTGSAVISAPVQEDAIYISSGTWSLIGVENPFPICVTKALDYNFTNEGGMDHQFRFLKNIMGLWMIQEVKRNYQDEFTFAELACLAQEELPFQAMVDVNDDRFLKPVNMIEEIQDYCRETGQTIPLTPGEVARCVFDSLAVSYKEAVEQIEHIFEKEFSQINVIGGGCQNEKLNQLIANVTGKDVYAGPVEATAIGNLAVQLMALGEVKDIKEVRKIIYQSFEVKKYQPENGQIPIMQRSAVK